MEEFIDFFNSSLDITKETDDPGYLLPDHFIYLSLGFKWILSLLILSMAGWVLATIKTTRLHKPHNIFVANLMIICIMVASTATFMATIMVVGHIAGVGDFIGCNVYHFIVCPIVELYYTFLMISADKMIAIVHPYQHKKMMTPCVVACTITASWVLTIGLASPKLFSPGDYTKVAQYSACLSHGHSHIEKLLGHTLPIVMSSLLAVTIDVHLAIKAYKQIEKETRLSGATSDQLKILRKKQASIKRHIKPMITLLIAVLGSTLTGVFIALLYYPVKAQETTTFYKQFMELIFITIIGYIVLLLQPFIYGLYFKQTREPMIKLLKNAFPNCKFNSVAPQP